MRVLLAGRSDAVPESGKGREVYWGLSTEMHVLWYVISAVSVLVFLFGVLRLYSKYRSGRDIDSLPLRKLPRRLGPTLVEVYSHRLTGRRDGLAKWAHRAILYGFTILFIGTVLVAINTDITKPIFGWSFLTGNFYLAYKLFLNVFGILFLGGLLAMMFRRSVQRPTKLDYTPQDPRGASSAKKAKQYTAGDWTFLLTLVFIGVTGYAVQGVRLAMEDPSYQLAHFGGIPFTWLFDSMLSESGLDVMRHSLWWVHGVVSVIWFSSIPYTKASHMLTSVVTLALRQQPSVTREPVSAPKKELK